jgi:predicted cupin superfamily sugar epimerase
MIRASILTTMLLGLCMPIGSNAAVPQAPSTREVRDSSNHGKSCQHPTPINKRTAQEVIKQLNLIPNIEKGYYVETFRDADNVTTASGGTADRSASTAIYYLLEGSDGFSHWHRVDATEVWHYYAGAPMTLSLSLDDGSPVRDMKLGPDVFVGQQPQVAIGKWEWQRAKSLGAWTLVGTTGRFDSLSRKFS